MKKYNLSKIMKAAWKLAREWKMNMSTALKRAWRDAKRAAEKASKKIITMSVARSEIFTVNTETGEIKGKTYNAKEFIKRNFNAKWNPTAKAWVADAEELKKEFTDCADYYDKYIVEDSKEGKAAIDEIISKELVNRVDGFYSRNTHASGRVTYSFVG